jgi:hypothetical protein
MVPCQLLTYVLMNLSSYLHLIGIAIRVNIFAHHLNINPFCYFHFQMRV